MKKLFLLPMLALASCATNPDTQPPVQTSQPAQGQDLVSQLAEYDEKSQAMIAAVDAALSPGATRKTIEAQAISPAFQQRLMQLRAEALQRFPSLNTNNAWIGESTQLVLPKDLTNVTPYLNGLLVVVTADPANPKKTAVVAKLKIDVNQNALTEYQLSSSLVGGYQNPALTTAFSGPMPYIRRVDKPLSSIDLYRPPLEIMNVSPEERGFIGISREGNILR